MCQVQSFSDWFKFNSKKSLAQIKVNLSPANNSIVVDIENSQMVKSSVVVNNLGICSFISQGMNHPAESYPSLSKKLIAIASRSPANIPLYMFKETFTYPNEKSQTPAYVILLARDLLSILRGQQPQYYTAKADIQFLTEVSVLLFGVENIFYRDKTNTQLLTNIMILDMISKKNNMVKIFRIIFVSITFWLAQNLLKENGILKKLQLMD